MRRILYFALAIICSASIVWADEDLSHASWSHVYKRMPKAWYATEQAQAIADTILAYQMPNGGWPKNIKYHAIGIQTPDDIATLIEAGTTIDNNATTSEMLFLAKVYTTNPKQEYRDAFMRGFEYILEAQYDNGGWPQFYPVRPPQGKHYSMHITYNDEAIANVLHLLRDIFDDSANLRPFAFTDSDRQRARQAYDRGIQNILDCQIIRNGKRTVWCAQHDHITLAPAKARAYELPSFSGQESVALINLLMDIPNPSQDVQEAVIGAVEWLRAHAIEGIVVERFLNADGERDCRVVKAEGAPLQWARFYDLETEKPFFCDRDGIKRSDLQEVGIERRGGYGWYTTGPQECLDRFPVWLESLK